MDDLWPALSTAARAKITKRILDTPYKDIAVRALARELDVVPSQVSETIKALEKAGVLKKKRVDLSNPLTCSLKRMFNLSEASVIVRAIKKNFKNVRGIGVYGSHATGKNDEKSDLDLWVKVDKWKGKELADSKLELSKRFGVDVQLTVIDDKELSHLKKSESPFYHSLYFGSELLWGESLD